MYPGGPGVNVFPDFKRKGVKVADLKTITVTIKVKQGWRTAFTIWLLQRNLRKLRILIEEGGL